MKNNIINHKSIYYKYTINYYSTKLFIFNLLNAIRLNKNKFLLSRKKKRMPYFYSNYRFNMKNKNWKIIRKSLLKYIRKLKLFSKYPKNTMQSLSKKSRTLRKNHRNYKLLEKIFNTKVC